MKRNYILTLITALALFASSMLQAQPAIGFYGATSKPFNGHEKPAFVYSNGNYGGDIYINDITTNGRYIMPCGCNVNGTYYGLFYTASDGLPSASGESYITPDKIVKVNWSKENTTFEDVVSDASALPTIVDMAYNFNDSKIYVLYVSNEKQYVAELTIDAQNDEASLGESIAMFETPKYRTIEFDYNGNLYALYTVVGKDMNNSDVYKVAVDKFSADFTSVEKTIVPANKYGNGIQQYNREYTHMSAEFDHLTGLLYLVTVTPYNDWDDEVKSQNIYEIDVNAAADGEAKKEQYTILASNWSDKFNASALSLYIPFTAPEAGRNAALAVTDLAVNADETGLNKAVLTWKNPTKNFGGNDLTTLHSVVVYRDDAKIATITENVTVGGDMSYTDDAAGIVTGNHTYRVVPCHAAGSEGISAEVSTWIGLDIPVAVWPSAQKTEDGTGVKITWNAPTSGVNGGIIGTDLKYTLTRVQDNKVIADRISETEIVDTQFPEWSTWSYSIVVNGKGGDSEAKETYGGVFFGPMPLSAPFSTDFDNYEATEMFNSWPKYSDFEYEEQQKLGIKTGEFQTWSGESRYKVDASYYKFEPDNLNPGIIDNWRLNNWVISPKFTLAAGTYAVDFKSFVEKAGDVAEFTVYLGTDQTKETQTTELKKFNITAAANDQIDDNTVMFEIKADGEYTVSFHFTSKVVAKSGDSDYHRQGLESFAIKAVETFAVEGKVLDADNKALVNVNVALVYGSASETATTDAEGMYRFTVKVIEGVTAGTLTFTKEDYVTATKDFTYSGENVAVEDQVLAAVVQTKTFAVNGTVVDADNKPVADAEVALTAGDKNETAKSAADGTFTFSLEVTADTESLAGTVKVKKEGFKELTKEFNYNGKDNVELGNLVLEAEGTGINLIYNASGVAEVKVYTLTGILIRNVKVSENDNFNIESLNLERGIYIINGEKRAIR